jgi:hypothetical protein
VGGASGPGQVDVHAVQIEAKTCRLTSADCFITLRPLPDDKSSVWLWVGKGTQHSEQAAAGALAKKLKQWFAPDRKCSVSKSSSEIIVSVLFIHVILLFLCCIVL